MTVRFYSSSDASAPALRGNTPGDIINLLDKCLVAGYGSKTAAGWTKPYTGTNLAVFRQGAGSNGFYLRVDDTQSSTSWRGARVVGYETMSDVNNGLPSPFPTAAQFAGGLYWFNHAGSGNVANPREWLLIADEAFFWLFINTYPENGVSNFYYNECYAFGDIIPFKPGDTTHTMLLGYARTSGNTSESFPFNGDSISSAQGTMRIAVARSYTNLGGPFLAGWHGDHVKGSTAWGAGNLSYPHNVDGGLYVNPIFLHEPQNSPYNVRGRLPGMWQPLHNFYGSTSQNQIIEGQGDLTGKTFLVRKHYQNSVMFEISDTWRD